MRSLILPVRLFLAVAVVGLIAPGDRLVADGNWLLFVLPTLGIALYATFAELSQQIRAARWAWIIVFWAAAGALHPLIVYQQRFQVVLPLGRYFTAVSFIGIMVCAAIGGFVERPAQRLPSDSNG